VSIVIILNALRGVNTVDEGILTMNIYKWFWSKIGGRPWTYIIRDVYHEAEWLIQTIWFALGVVVGLFSIWQVAVFLWLIYTFGYINGHLFWGTKWIQGQKGK
jgi:hypothetical protein